jgi:hypothetical protein
MTWNLISVSTLISLSTRHPNDFSITERFISSGRNSTTVESLGFTDFIRCRCISGKLKILSANNHSKK